MSSFTNVLLVSPLSDGKRWVIRKEFTYYRTDNPEDKITVPVGFVTDFASVPKMFRRIVARWGTYGNAAVIHDYLYATEEKSRKKSDKIFLEAMEVLDVSIVKRYLMYWAVRLVGSFSYGNKGTFLEVSEETEEINKIELQVY